MHDYTTDHIMRLIFFCTSCGYQIANSIPILLRLANDILSCEHIEALKLKIWARMPTFNNRQKYIISFLVYLLAI